MTETAKCFYARVEREAQSKFGDRFFKNAERLSFYVVMNDLDGATLRCVESYYGRLHSVPDEIVVEPENIRRLAKVLIEIADKLGV